MMLVLLLVLVLVLLLLLPTMLKMMMRLPATVLQLRAARPHAPRHGRSAQRART